MRRLARQIDSRNQLLDVTERDARKLEVEVARTDSVARGLSASLDAHKRRYAEMVREAYRNYKHNNYLTYLFSSSDFNQVARRITNLREVAAMRERQMEQIVTQMAKENGVTEELKERDPMKWVGLMNNLQNAAEEIILKELIYS